MSNVKIVEVGLRDGLQNEQSELTFKDRYLAVQKFSKAGLKRIELGSFVSPKFITGMEKMPSFVKKVLKAQETKSLPQNISFSAFVPNLKGFEKALVCGLKEISYFVSCTETFSKKNINMSIKDSLKNLDSICKQALKSKIKVRVYLSVAFFCPYEGRSSIAKVSTLATQIMDKEVFELSVSDTVGMAAPTDVHKLLENLHQKISLQKLALHFHDTRGMALANVVAGAAGGVRTFDSSIGGMGGCPYALGASGNAVTEDLVYLLEKMKFKTGVKVSELIKITRWLEKKLKHKLPSKLVLTGLGNKL